MFIQGTPLRGRDRCLPNFIGWVQVSELRWRWQSPTHAWIIAYSKCSTGEMHVSVWREERSITYESVSIPCLVPNAVFTKFMTTHTLIILLHSCYFRRNSICARRTPGLWREGSVLGHSIKRVSWGLNKEQFWKTYLCFGALYCICCKQNINCEHSKVSICSLFLFEKKLFATAFKHTWNYNWWLFVSD